jgi:hypothetical protein
MTRVHVEDWRMYDWSTVDGGGAEEKQDKLAAQKLKSYLRYLSADLGSPTVASDMQIESDYCDISVEENLTYDVGVPVEPFDIIERIPGIFAEIAQSDWFQVYAPRLRRFTSCVTDEETGTEEEDDFVPIPIRSNPTRLEPTRQKPQRRRSKTRKKRESKKRKRKSNKMERRESKKRQRKSNKRERRGSNKRQREARQQNKRVTSKSTRPGNNKYWGPPFRIA